MNILSKITLQSLRRNRTRTIVTIIGIMLSAAMICAVTTFVASIQRYLLDLTIYKSGDWHGAAFDMTAEQCAALKADADVSEIAVHQQIGYAKIDSTNPYKPYLFLIGAGEGRALDMLSVHLTDGRYPENANEVILPDHLRTNGGMVYEIGDEITLALGERMLEGKRRTQSNPCYMHDPEIGDTVLLHETLTQTRTNTYTVVGYFERPGFEYNAAPGYTAITLSDTEAPAQARYNVYFKIHHPEDIFAYMRTHSLYGDQNSDLLMFMGVFRFNSFSNVIVNLSAVVIALIVLGSVSLIYNAFAISVSERTKQFGILSSVGATRKQLRASVRFEALCVSAIGIPLGILVGIGGIGVTLLLLGDKFSTLVGSYSVPIHVCISWEAIVIAVAIALVTVLLSALIPARRASAVSAVEAIRQSNDIKDKKKQVKTSYLSYALFGLPAVLANKYYKRSRKKYRATVISLFLSIVLFVSASAFSDYLVAAVVGGFGNSNYDLFWNMTPEDSEKKSPDEALSLCTSDRDVTDAVYIRRVKVSAWTEKEALTPSLASLLDGGVPMDPLSEGLLPLDIYLCFVNDAAYAQLLVQNGLNEKDFSDAASPRALLYDVNTVFDSKSERFVTLDSLQGDRQQLIFRRPIPQAGYTYTGNGFLSDGSLAHLYRESGTGMDDASPLRIPYAEGVSGETVVFETGKALKERPFFLASDSGAYANLIYPISLYAAVLPEELQQEGVYAFYIASSNHGASFENLKTVLSENGLSGNTLVDIAADEEQNRNIVTIIQVFAYGFVVLISLISAANVFNTISTNISLRRREFAMLRSVGMTEKGFRKMMDFECLRYGFKALLLGLPAAVGINYLMYLSLMEGYEIPFFLPWRAILISVFSVFLVVFSTMLYATRKLKRENLIDALKNENL